MLHKRDLPRVKRMLLTVMAVGCGAVSSCGFGLKDIRHNVVAGTASFLSAYTVEFWNTVVPSWNEVLNFETD